MENENINPNTYWWQDKKYAWILFGLGGGLFGIVIGVLLFPVFRCLQLRTNAATWTYFSLLVGIPGAIWGILKPILEKKPSLYRQVSAATIGLLICSVVPLASAVLAVEMPGADQCDPQLRQLSQLIETEGQAVLKRDMNLIAEVYDSNAQIINQAGKLNWDTPFEYYRQKFDTESHCEVGHADFTVTSRDASQIIVTTSSFGAWGARGGTACSEHYNNPPGSDEWTFRKNGQGEWRIVKLVFNRQ